MKPLVDMLLEAPDSQLDSKMLPFIRKWSDPPKAVEVLEVLDYCVNGALASGVVMQVLNILYERTCSAENTTHDAVAKLATWRESALP